MDRLEKFGHSTDFDHRSSVTIAPNRFRLIGNTEQEVIVDVEHNVNFLFLAGSGFGINSSTRDLAIKVVDFLNSLPEKETLLYPYNT